MVSSAGLAGYLYKGSEVFREQDYRNSTEMKVCWMLPGKLSYLVSNIFFYKM